MHRGRKHVHVLPYKKGSCNDSTSNVVLSLYSFQCVPFLFTFLKASQLAFRNTSYKSPPKKRKEVKLKAVSDI